MDLELGTINVDPRVVSEDPVHIIVLRIPTREECLSMWLKVPHMTVAGDQMPSSTVEGVYAGQPIRYPLEPIGRFEPVEREGYLEELLAPDRPIDELSAPPAGRATKFGPGLRRFST